MAQPLLSGSLESTLRGELIGQLVVGDHLLSVGSEHGSWLSPVTEQPVIEPKKLPILQIPPAFSSFQGRQAEVEAAIAALQQNQLVILCGLEGIGKSVMMRVLAHHHRITTSRADGIVYFNHRQPLADLEQILFDIFYQATPAVKPTAVALRQALQTKQIVLLLDGSDLTGEEVRKLRSLLPNSPCVMASHQAVAESVVIQLAGLSLPETLTLVEQILGHSLPPEQAILVEPLWKLLEGHPQRLKQAIALVHQDGLTLAKIGQKLQPDIPARSLTRLILAALPKTQRWIVALLVAMKGVGLQAEQIAAMTGPPNPQPSLQALLQRYLIHLDGYRYCLASSLVDILQEDFNPDPWMARVLAYLVPWGEQYRHAPKQLLEEQEVILHTLRWAVKCELWGDVLSLARSLESALILDKQWQTWEQVLQWALQAAWALEDSSAEAWALHQLGTRALCLEEVTAAYDALSQALSLRNSLGDEIGNKLTQGNLDLLKQVALPEPKAKRSAKANPASVYLMLGVMGLLVFGGSLLVGWTIVRHLSQSSPEVVPVESPQS